MRFSGGVFTVALMVTHGYVAGAPWPMIIAVTVLSLVGYVLGRWDGMGDCN